MSGGSRTHVVATAEADDDLGPGLVISVTRGVAHGAPAAFTQRRVVVGRAEGADLRIADPTVSAFHVELTATREGVEVADLGSSNGTLVGEVLLRRARVPFGTELALGEAAVRVERGEGFLPARSDRASFGALVGASPPMRELFALLERLARTDLAVLLEGETGTGKELAARALHAESRRATGPFVVVDCTAIPPSLAESALFGHEKGAFTGATERRDGLLVAASGGTVFFDEVGELAPDLQPKLLGALERREVTPVGANRAKKLDVRVIGATLRDLRAMVNERTFREDLYFRLAQARARMPSLAERPADVRPLVQHVLASMPWDVPAARAIDRAALDALAGRPFRGNVRELKSTVERLAMLADGPTITVDDVAFDRRLDAERGAPPVASVAPGPPSGDDEPLEPFKEAKRTVVDEFELAYLTRLLARAGSNVSKAANLAGIERQSLRDLLRRHGLRGS